MSLFSSHVRRSTLPLLVFAFIHSAWAIVVPYSYVEVHGQDNELGDRGLIVESIINDEIRREEFLKSVPCIGNFLVKYIPEPAWTSFVIVVDDEKSHNAAHSLATRLRENFAFYKHSVDTDFEVQQSASSTIIMMPNASSLLDDFYILKPCDHGCPFVTILTTAFEDQQSFLEEADALVQSMWRRKIFTVVILAKVRDAVLAAGSTTFQPDKPCTPSSPAVLDKCGIEKLWRGLKRIKRPKMNSCILKVAYFDEPPYVITVNGSEKLLGFEGVLTEDVLRHQSIYRERVEWNGNVSYSEQVQAFLYNEVMADLVIGRILQQPHDDVDYSTSYDMLKVVWVVPKVPNVSLKGLVQPLHPYVWAAIGATLLLGVVSKLFLRHDLSWLEVFALIIGVSTARQPIRLSSKIKFISWSIFGLFLTQVYVDSLADQLINMSDLKLETTAQLISSSFQIGGTAAFASFFDQLEQTDRVLEMRRKFVTFDADSYMQQFNDLLDGRNSSFALVTVLNSSRSGAIETVHAYTLTTDVIYSFPLALATWKGFPYLRHINNKIHNYIDLGILDTMIELAVAKNTRAMLFQIAEDKEYKTKLHLQQFIPAFLLMVIGFSSGLLCFVIEVIIYPSKFLK